MKNQPKTVIQTPAAFVIHLRSKLALMPYRSAMLATDTPGFKHACTN